MSAEGFNSNDWFEGVKKPEQETKIHDLTKLEEQNKKQQEYNKIMIEIEAKDTAMENYNTKGYYEQTLKNNPEIAFDNIKDDFFYYNSSQEALEEEYGVSGDYTIKGKILKELGFNKLINQLSEESLKILNEEGNKRLKEFKDEINKLKTDKEFQISEFPINENYGNIPLKEQVKNRINYIKQRQEEIKNLLYNIKIKNSGIEQKPGEIAYENIKYMKNEFLNDLNDFSGKDLFEGEEGVYNTLIEIYDYLKPLEKSSVDTKIKQYLKGKNVELTEDFKIVKARGHLTIDSRYIKTSGYPTGIELDYGKTNKQNVSSNVWNLDLYETIEESPTKNLEEAIYWYNEILKSKGQHISYEKSDASLKQFSEKSETNISQFNGIDIYLDGKKIGKPIFLVNEGGAWKGELKSSEAIFTEIQKIFKNINPIERSEPYIKTTDEQDLIFQEDYKQQIEKSKLKVMSSLLNSEPKDFFENKDLYNALIESFDSMNQSEKKLVTKMIGKYLKNYGITLNKDFIVTKPYPGQSFIINKKYIKSGFPTNKDLELYFG